MDMGHESQIKGEKQKLIWMPTWYISWNNERKGKKTSISGCFWLAEAAEAANKICNLV